MTNPIEAPDRVLSTLNRDGSRRWIRPRPARGRFLRARRLVAYALMAVFIAIPLLRLNGKPLILLDIPHREFTLFGATFLATDMLLFMLLLAGSMLAIFFVTALFGRVWCGWGCPQTVYMEFLFRPVEYLIERTWRGTEALDERGWFAPRRLVKNLVFLVLAFALAHVFLAYFVGADQLARWIWRSPVNHWTSFMVVVGTTALIFFDFAYFREQTCLVACPYGRLQSVLLDRRSLIVGYDTLRGEPRVKGIRDRDPSAGDCIDCKMCVYTCPTGIDIREGLQMECIHCTQCMDACDRVMLKIKKPPGLIRYGSRDGFERKASGWLRPRAVIYPAAVVGTLGAFAVLAATRPTAEVTVLRGLGEPYTLAPDAVVNQIRIKVTNRGKADGAFRIELVTPADARLVAPVNPLPVAAGATEVTSVFVMLPPGTIEGGARDASFRVSDGRRFTRDVPYRLVGPEPPAGPKGATGVRAATPGANDLPARGGR